MQKLLIVCDSIKFPIDEGLKKFTYNFIHFCLKNLPESKVLASPSNLDNQEIKTFKRSKTFLNLQLYREIYHYNPQRIIYIPEASSTFFSFIRVIILNLYACNAKVIMISSQKRKHNYLTQQFIKFGKFNLITFSKSGQIQYQNLGVNTSYIPLGVDTKTFEPCSKIVKMELRKKYNLNCTTKYALHVGHIKKNRNIDSLTALLDIGYKVIIVGSSSTEQDISLSNYLKNLGVIIFDQYIEKISELYQLADVYIFPVKNADGAIEFPLSVLEAMSTNIPVISTKFGGLIDTFQESEHFKFFSSKSEMIEKFKNLNLELACNNRKIVLNEFKWEKIFENILQN
ncbi:glycosyltransferase [Acetobacteroides hydrogenigenes]|uniref:Glycosyltransferase involved in cell wall biosynthesis n=1 Tax=Acetobacteroides hydrogenigenes TaxID=979970 RepID=A0A4R2EWD6_9BACT|nr:glycosyltransferase [Acetobacteroides hydrogenigenes]TCN72136.1 glycosyltransferase involved in cell wall biosynthesis [Acetobacteroides hydrogenigenes]